MVDLVVSSLQLVLALVLVVLNGFFVASEFAFVRVRATSVEQLAAEGRTGSATLQDVMDNLDDYLAATQLGITLASLGLGWVGEPAVAALIEPIIGSLLPAGLVHLVAFAIGFSIITFLHVVFGELAPKTIAISQAERLSLFLAPPMKLSYRLFAPGIVVFNGTANAFTQLLGVPPASESDETLEEREIRRVLARSGEAGHVAQSEVEMIESVFDLDDTTVREAMVPRPDVVTLSGDRSLSEIRATVLEAGHTRYPVVAAENHDQVTGYLDVKDVLGAGEEETTAAELSREIMVVPEMTSLRELLLQFQDEHRQMAAVVDEWGAFEGMVTIEDTVEAVVGDLRDDFDVETSEPVIRQDGPDAYDADGAVPLSTVNDVLGTDFEAAGYETLAGLVLDQLARAPEQGDTVSLDGFLAAVTAVDGSRIESVRLTRDETDRGPEVSNTDDRDDGAGDTDDRGRDIDEPSGDY
ncbi:Hemolysins or related protein containing CBS domains [Halapricum desulfuricans]|uniref:Hemolysins or related protein containing CBS domains n=1 Tax=Halapricum desulfuricans TaxID=2841257 RepID=A0A897NDJ1_9EURY|nr:hemolysin family protein [Halapricum desulfuricans]QSG10732.1 Hemolysins or related protein containing CBS domains [Halapricum desulfuricans]